MKLFIIVVISSLFLKIDQVFAQKLENADDNLSKVAGAAGISADVSLSQTVGNMIKGGLSAVGLIFFILIFYGGFSWMIARGNEQKVEKAKNTVIAASIGLVIVLASYAITILIGGTIKK